MTTSYRADGDEPDPDDADAAPTPFADSALNGATRPCAMRWVDGTRCGGRVWGGACDLCGAPDPDDVAQEPVLFEEIEPLPAPDAPLDVACPHPPERYRFSTRTCDACGARVPPPGCTCPDCGPMQAERAESRHVALHQVMYRAFLRRGESSYF